MGDSVIDDLQSRCRALDARLDAEGAAGELDGLKVDIGALFKTVDQQIVALTSVRDDVLKLIEKWKGVRAAPRPWRSHAGTARRARGRAVVAA